MRQRAGRRCGVAVTLALTSIWAGGCSSDRAPSHTEDGTPLPTTFSKSYGGPGIDAPYAVRATRDGGIVLVGHSGARIDNAAGPQDGDLWINKLDANGNVEQQYNLGVLSLAGGSATTFDRVRAAPDGGYVAIGGPGIAVARFDSAGTVLWSNSYDSGPWLNYEFDGGSTASAVDYGRDIWPLPDGGFWVVADSHANLRDVRDIGFDGPNDRSDLFVDARSVVVLRLNGAGEVVQRRRLTEDAFGTYGREDNRIHGWNFDYPIVRATADGGAILARRKRFRSTPESGGSSEEHSATLVQRLFADGAVRWTQRLDDALFPTDLLEARQTGDVLLVAHEEAGEYLEPWSCPHIVRFSADGDRGWSEELDCDIRIESILEFCNPGPLPTCALLLPGSDLRRFEEGFIQRMLPVDGTLIDSVRFAPEYPEILSIAQVSRGEGDERLLALGRGVPGDRAHILRLRPDTLEVLSRERTQFSLEHAFSIQEIPDSRVTIFTAATQRLSRVSFTGEVEADFVTSAPGTRTDRGLAVIETQPNRFIVAGDSRSFSEVAGDGPRKEAWVAAYDATRGEIAWQRRFTEIGSEPAHVAALALAGDGGVVLGGRLNRAMRAIKMDSSGELVWQSLSLDDRPPNDGFIRIFRELHATPDGGFASLVAKGENSDLLNRAVLVKLAENGMASWVRSFVLESAGSFEPIDDDGDGVRDDGFIMASAGLTGRDLLTAVKLDANGHVLWVRGYRPAGDSAPGDGLGFPRVRQTPDGGFVLAIQELGIVSTLNADAQVQPQGEANVAVLKLSGAGDPQWLRVYGARYDEELHDLDVAVDGTLLLAGRSRSFGDQDAWLLKLGPDGLVAAGCNAFLGSLSAELIDSELFEPRLIALPAQTMLPDPNDPPRAPRLAETSAPLRAAEDSETARQCLGTASPASPAQPTPQFTLTVNQAGTRDGPVISTPRGIACGTGLGDEFCSAEFPTGTRVTLTADAADFRRWDTPCDEGTGGTATVCSVTVDRDRSVAVVFDEVAPTPDTATLTVQLNNASGSASVESQPTGIQCTSAPDADCTETYGIGTQVLLRPAPAAQFGGWQGCDAIVDGLFCQITLQTDRSVTATFAP